MRGITGTDPNDRNSPKERIEYWYGNVDREHIAMLAVAPIYPERAVKYKIEGSVTIVFDVTPEGKSVIIRIKESTHGVFKSVSIDATEKLLYLSARKKGRYVTVEGVENTFTYSISKQNGME